jgi:hypothetical protein
MFQLPPLHRSRRYVSRRARATTEASTVTAAEKFLSDYLDVGSETGGIHTAANTHDEEDVALEADEEVPNTTRSSRHNKEPVRRWPRSGREGRDNDNDDDDTASDDPDENDDDEEASDEPRQEEGRRKRTHKKKKERKEEEKRQEDIIPTTSTGMYDMRLVFPIDESHAPSVRELAKLSAYLHTMGRHFSLMELMGYVATWFAVGRALVRINDQEYKTQTMLFSDTEVRCTCYLFEVIQRLHQVAYMVFRHAVEHLRAHLTHNEAACILPRPTDTNDSMTVLKRSQLKRMLLTVIEMCRMAIRDFHPAWKDLHNGLMQLPDAGLRETKMFQYSARHTAILGTLATHLLQALVAVAFWNDRQAMSADEVTNIAWETASVLAQLKVNIVPECMQTKFPYNALLDQLKLLVYKRRLEQTMEGSLWAQSVWLAQQIAQIDPADTANNEVWHTATYNAQITHDTDTALPIADLHDRAVKKKNITSEQIQIMDPNALSTVYRNGAFDAHTGQPKMYFVHMLPEVKLRIMH